MSKKQITEIPILTEDNMCIGPYRVNDECGCLAYWRGRVFGPYRSRYDVKAYRALCAELRRILGTATTDDSNYGFITRRMAARAWNRAWAALGYTEGNPEARNVGKVIRPYRKSKKR